MKKFFFSAVVLAASLIESQASILYQDNFDSYTPGNLVGQGVWAAHSGAGLKPVQISAGAITLQQSAGSGEDVNAALGATMGAGDSWYYSFDVSVTGSSAENYFAMFMQGTSLFEGKLLVEPFAGSDFTFGVSGSANTVALGASTWGTGFTFGSTHRIVVGLNYDTKTATLWVDPASQTSTSLSNIGLYQNAVTSIAFRQSSPTSANYQVIDNLVVATSFQEALTGVAVPEPSTLAMAALGGFALLSLGFKRRK